MDHRELILSRLVAVLAAVPGVVLAARNRDGLSDRQRPAIVLLDADETARDGEPRGRSGPSPQIVDMTPELYILLGSTPAAVGSELNALRALVIEAVTTDATLLSLTGRNGRIRYDGCATGLARGRTMEGEMGVSFTFSYPFDPNKL